MKIGIISDIHGNIEAWQTIINGVFQDVAQILIAGDIYGAGFADPSSPWFQPQKLKLQMAHSPLPLLCIRGNCDPKTMYPDTLTGELFGKKFYMCHGQHCGEADIEALAAQHQAFYFIYGHTHRWRLEKKNGVMIINPGSPTLPDREPKHATVAVLDEKKIQIVDIHSREALAELENK